MNHQQRERIIIRMTDKVREMGSEEKEALKLKRNQEPKDNAGEEEAGTPTG
jgi:hypothetical protein